VKYTHRDSNEVLGEGRSRHGVLGIVGPEHNATMYAGEKEAEEKEIVDIFKQMFEFGQKFARQLQILGLKVTEKIGESGVCHAGILRYSLSTAFTGHNVSFRVFLRRIQQPDQSGKPLLITNPD
jgi:hypothetical protein